jgi:hypothetical protein
VRPDLSPFLELIRRSRRWLRRAALIPLLPLVGAVFVPFPDEVPFLVIRWGFVGLCLLISAMLLSTGVGAPTAHPGIQALSDPPSVCWLFVERIRDARTGDEGAPTLQIGLVSGERRMLPMEEGREDELLELAATAAPHATRGWTAELEHRFLQQPRSLLHI